MPARASAYLHPIVIEGPINLTTSFPASGTSVNIAGVTIPNFYDKAWCGLLEGVTIHVNSIAAGATSITFRITADSGGDYVIVPDTTATLQTGVTTATDGSACYSGQGLAITNIINDTAVKNGVFYLFAKTNLGTAVVESATIVWRE